MEPKWPNKAVVLAIHEEQLAEHGGQEGLRDEGLLDSALEKAKNLFAYGDPPPTLFHMAAAYACGITRNHPFLDGNKRASFVVSVLFLAMNGYELHASEPDKVRVWLSLAEGHLDEQFLAGWFSENSSIIY